MSDKQRTGTITLPGVDPELYELTGEVRQATSKEWYFDTHLNSVRQLPDTYTTTAAYIILRRKPRKIRVTPTQADLDAAAANGLGGVRCWVRDDSWNPGYWEEAVLIAISPLSRRHRFCTTHKTGIYEICEIEKEVNDD